MLKVTNIRKAFKDNEVLKRIEFILRIERVTR